MSARSDPVLLTQSFAGRWVDAVVSPVGASLQGLTVDGLELVCGDPNGPVASSGAVLVPWPNRVRDARWLLNGEPQRLEVTEPAARNALHGLVAATPFEVIARDRSSAAAPVAVGVHPYVRVGDARAAGLSIQVDAQRTLLLGDDHLPLRETPVEGTRFDLRRPTALAEAPWHAAYTGLRAEVGRVRLRLVDARSSETVDVWADDRFRWAQVYLTDELPGLPEGGVAVALEPMTAPPDALNSGTDLRWLPPSSRWALDWGVDRGRA